MKLGASRALADLLGGSEGGFAFWLAALAQLELAVARARDGRDRFGSHPPGELRRLLRDVDDALSLAATAVDVQLLVNDEPDGDGPARRADIAAMLLERARAASTRDA